jgi:hypothetical protein
VLIGDLLARFADEAVATETLVMLGDLALIARIACAAAEEKQTVGEFAASSVRRFADRASDQDWLTVLGRLARSEDPGREFLRNVLSSAVTYSDLTASR